MKTAHKSQEAKPHNFMKAKVYNIPSMRERSLRQRHFWYFKRNYMLHVTIYIVSGQVIVMINGQRV